MSENVRGERWMRDRGLQQFGRGAHSVWQHESGVEARSGPSPLQTRTQIPRRAPQMPLTGRRCGDPQFRERPQLHGQIHSSR